MNGGEEMVRGLGEIADALFSRIEQAASKVRDYEGNRVGYHIDADTFRRLRAEARTALAAHVLGLVTAGKAEALREAAKELPGFDGIRTHGDAARWLRARADGLAGEAS